MLPMVVAGGLLIALSLCFGLNAAEQAGSLPAILKQIGAAAFTLMVPMLSGYIAYSIADRPGLAPGLIGDYWQHSYKQVFRRYCFWFPCRLYRVIYC